MFNGKRLRIFAWLPIGLCIGSVLVGQTLRRPLIVNQSRYRVVAGERIPIQAPAETLAFMLSAKTRIARASGRSNRSFPVAPNVAGDQVLIGIALTTDPGEYTVAVSFANEAGEERSATFQMSVEPLGTVSTGSSIPPVVLLDGWQPPNLSSTCPMYADSEQTFKNLESYLYGSPNVAPAVYFFENCTECPNCSIEQLGADLGTFLNSLHYSNGASVPQVDVVAHSMGGLIVRSYLSGKQTGGFSPPGTSRIRKAVFIGTPHFGSFQADSLLADIFFAFGIQTNELKRASQFVWDLATWNQFRDDLRGTDALAVIGNAGSYEGLSQASDGVVALTSGSLDFVTPGRTRIINYCHIPPGPYADLIGCVGPGIAYVDTPSHATYQIVSSFLLDSAAWQGVGSSPAQNPYLSKDGGMIVADVGSTDQYVIPSGVSWGQNVLLTPGAASELSYNDFVFGTDTFNFGTSTCGPYTQPPGVYSTVRCKFLPTAYSVGPLLPGSGRVVQAGTTITISGVGFGAQQCATCRVTASNPQSTVLQISSWSDTAIRAFLPGSFGAGIAQIGVTTATGFDAINIMAGTVAVSPAIALSSTHIGSFVQGQPSGVYTLSVQNTGTAATSGSVSVTDTLPVGLTATAINGPGWTCSLDNLICSRSDPLPAGGSYPPITLTVSVASNAASPVTNQVIASGGSSATATASDPTTIVPAFTDIPASDSSFIPFIDQLQQSGITKGCQDLPPMYCSTAPIPESQMAVFVIRSVFGSDNFDYTPTPYFTDVPATNLYFPWIQKMQDLGIGLPCSQTQYCPDSVVTRGIMSVLIIRSRFGVATPTNYPTTPYFTDVPASHPYFPWIQKMKQLGITSGCTPTTYCPDIPVTRGQMAVFIMRGEFNQGLQDPSTPVLVWLNPASGSPGQTAPVTIIGQNTNFSSGVTQVNAGSGITVSSISVSNGTTLIAQFAVAAGATLGPRSITVTTGSEEATLPNRFRVQ